jgi:hypothetical protein
MPNARNVQTMYFEGGNPDTWNESSLYAPGMLGNSISWRQKEYQIVQLDSGATASTDVGAVVANDLAFWKDPDNYIVTNDAPQALGGQTTNAWRNFVAGVFRYAVTAGNYCAILQKGDNIPVNGAAGGGVGQTVIANSGSDADVTFVAVATASTYRPLGIAREATADTTAGMVNTDLNIPYYP